MIHKLVIGSRESKLARIQSELVRDYIKKKHPQWEVSLLTMKTTGDIILDRTLDKIGGKGLFVKELDKALLEGRSDLSVHSLKDMPMEVPESLPLVAFSTREDPRDVFVLPKGRQAWDPCRPVGCSSLRRTLQFQKLYPDARVEPVRGNVLTRLSKLDSGAFSGLILAAAGLKRLGLEKRISRYFEPEEMIPAAGQGILAIQGRQGQDYSYLSEFGTRQDTSIALCERAFVRTLNGGCSSPVAAFAKVSGSRLYLLGLYYNEEDRNYLTGCAVGDLDAPQQLGEELAQKLQTQYRKGKG